ncbi:hypothetical protein G4B84_009999, partial [Aspergillus flavus NRRL3357]
MAPPKSAIIIGGSISGLLQALQLKRAGTDVLILEQDPSPTRASHESGVSIGPSVLALLKKYDATGTPPAIPAGFLSVAWQTRPRVLNTAWHHDMSNWGSLYLILRANVDGFASDVVPYPPPGRKGDGTAEYKAGRRVVGVEFDRGDGAMNVLHVEAGASRGSRQGMEVKRERAEMVIAADGVHSTIRRFLQVPTTWTYAGYIAWRGTVREDQLSPETLRYFSDRLNFTLLAGSYFITYIIPSETGSVEPGRRLVNWVWYYPVPEGSVAMDTIFTDINGVLHNSTVPGDLLDPKVWSVQKRRYISDGTTPHLAEVVSQTRRPFVTKVGEVEASAASYFDGRLVLVGDAFATFRSHLGLASEQAARHCLQMDRVWSGEISQAARDREARLYAAKLLLLNRLMGFLGLGWWWSALKTGLAYACGGTRILQPITGGSIQGAGFNGTIDGGLSAPIHLDARSESGETQITKLPWIYVYGHADDGSPFFIEEAGIGSVGKQNTRVVIQVGGVYARLQEAFLVGQPGREPG